MFTYYYRIFDKFGENVTALAVFTGESKKFATQSFENNVFGTNLKYDFRLFVVNQQDEQTLLNSTNPFALVVLAMLYALKSESNNDQRLQYKTSLMRLMLKQKYNRPYIERMLIFLTNILTLPEDLETEFYHELNDNIKPKDMVTTLQDYVDNVRYYMAKKEGIQEGLVKGERKGILKGKQEGKQEGKIEGKLEGAKLKSYEFGIRLLEHNYTDEQIVDLAGLSIAEVDILKKLYSEHGKNAYKYITPNILNN